MTKYSIINSKDQRVKPDCGIKTFSVLAVPALRIDSENPSFVIILWILVLIFRELLLLLCAASFTTVVSVSGISPVAVTLICSSVRSVSPGELVSTNCIAFSSLSGIWSSNMYDSSFWQLAPQFHEKSGFTFYILLYIFYIC